MYTRQTDERRDISTQVAIIRWAINNLLFVSMTQWAINNLLLVPEYSQRSSASPRSYLFQIEAPMWILQKKNSERPGHVKLTVQLRIVNHAFFFVTGRS